MARVEQELARQGQRVRDEAARLDDLKSKVDALAEMLRRIPEELAVLRERVNVAISKSDDGITKQAALEEYLRRRDELQMLERKSDRRWLIGTVLTSAGLVIAALALLVH